MGHENMRYARGMRTVRELSGWALLPAVGLVPLVAIVVLFWGALRLIAPEDAMAEVPTVVIAFAFFGALCWPRIYLSSRRLREPQADEIAEADERAPVLIL